MTLKNSRKEKDYEDGDLIKFGSIVFVYRWNSSDSGAFILKECPEGMSHITQVKYVNNIWWCGTQYGRTPWHAYVAATTSLLRLNEEATEKMEQELQQVRQRRCLLKLTLAIIEAQEEGEAV